MTIRERIYMLLTVSSIPLRGSAISKITGCGPGSTYTALWGLERDGMITSAWIEGPKPRTRVYEVRR